MGDYELYHASNRKHKYIKKIGNRYFYTQQEIQAYLQSKNATPQTASDYVTTGVGEAKKVINKKRKQFHELKEATAEATGRRDSYFEAKKVTDSRGRTYYDDDNPTLRRGNINKRSNVKTYTYKGKKYKEGYTTEGTMVYDNEYVQELNRKTRERGRKKVKKMTGIDIAKIQKNVSRGKRAIAKMRKRVSGE